MKRNEQNEVWGSYPPCKNNKTHWKENKIIEHGVPWRDLSTCKKK